MLRLTLYGFLFFCGICWAVNGPAAAACVAAMTYLVNPRVFIPEFTVVRVQLVSSLILITVLFFNPRRDHVQGTGGRWILWPLTVFTLLCLASTSWAYVSPEVAWRESVQFAKTILFTVLLAAALRSIADVRLFMWTCIIGAWHGAMAHVVGINAGYLPQRFAGEYGVFPDEHAGVLVILVPIIAVHAVWSKSWTARLFCWGTLAIVLVSIVNTYRRTPFVGLAVEACFLFYLLPKRVIARALPVVLVLAAAVSFRMPQDYWDRMATILTPTQERSANARFIIQEAYWRMALDHPWGVGYRNSIWSAASYIDADMLTEGTRAAHNTYLTVLTEVGFLGFALWGLAVSSCLLQLNRLRRSTGTDHYLGVCSMALIAGLLGWLASGWTFSYNQSDPAYWYMGVTVAMLRIKRQGVSADASSDGLLAEDDGLERANG